MKNNLASFPRQGRVYLVGGEAWRRVGDAGCSGDLLGVIVGGWVKGGMIREGWVTRVSDGAVMEWIGEGS